jgi:hypothetical protein
LSKNNLNLQPGTYDIIGDGELTYRFVDEWAHEVHGTGIDIYPHGTLVRVAKVWTPLDIQPCGFNRCGDFTLCPLHKNVSTLDDEVTLNVEEGGDTYISFKGQRVCDRTCQANRETCGLNLILIEP